MILNIENNFYNKFLQLGLTVESTQRTQQLLPENFLCPVFFMSEVQRGNNIHVFKESLQHKQFKLLKQLSLHKMKILFANSWKFLKDNFFCHLLQNVDNFQLTH